MIIVTGTKRSGTSMWMQVLAAAGLPVIGETFPKNWGESIRDANPHGFYESVLRNGIFEATNPHPKTGEYFAAEATRTHAVKVFVPGLARTDPTFIDAVIATVRDWREFVSSLERLYAMEDEAAVERGDPPPERTRVEPVLEWWMENFALVRDVVERGHATYFVTYGQAIERPDVIEDVLRWVDAPELAAGVAAASADARTQSRARLGRSHLFEQVFDSLYETIASRQPFTKDFLQRLNEVHRELAPEIGTQLPGGAGRDRKGFVQRLIPTVELDADVSPYG